jgi:hypothetical protein
LLNGDTLANKVAQGNVVGQRLQEGKTPQEIFEELYIRCLARKPTEKEVREINAIIETAPDKKLILEDTFWALLNSREFVFNHAVQFAQEAAAVERGRQRIALGQRFGGGEALCEFGVLGIESLQHGDGVLGNVAAR